MGYVIDVTQDKDNVVVNVYYPVPGNGTWHISFRNNMAGGVSHAGFIAKAMNDNVRDNLERIRRTAYEEGWKDAKAKDRKRQFFHGSWV